MKPATPTSPTESPSRACLRAFVEGATRASLPAILGAVAVALAWFAASALLLTPRTMAGPAGRLFVTDRDDEYADLTHRALALAARPARGDSVTIFGASTVREAITSPSDLSERLGKLVGRPVGVNLMVSGGLASHEALILLDTIRKSLRGVVVLDVAPQKFIRDAGSLDRAARNPRLALESPAFDALAREFGFAIPERSGNYFLDHHRFFVARPLALANLARPTPKIAMHRAEDWGALNDAQWRKAVDRMGRWRGSYDANRDFNRRLLVRTIALARESGLRVALLESTRNPRATRELQGSPEERASYDRYGADITAFAREQGVPYWDLNEGLGLEPSEFADQNHLRDPSARRRYTQALAERVAALLSGEGGP